MSDSGTLVSPKSALDIDKIRSEFPMMSRQINGKPLIYLDNAATTHKPWAVINRVYKFESEEYGTVRRGAYRLSEHATQLYEETRQKVADLLGASSKSEIVFTSGATQSINLVAYSYGRKFVNAGD